MDFRECELSPILVEGVEKRREQLVGISRFIWENPEVGYEEYKASEILVNALEEGGFDITHKACGMETAFIAQLRSPHQGPCIALLAEYDSLGPLGHACGHNLFSVAAVGGALALADVLERTGGVVMVLGTPAEEGVVPDAGGKITMIEQGVFDNVDVAMMCHAEGRTIIERELVAATVLECTFTGKAAHAGGSPQEGINALNAGALTIMNINAYRQHLPPKVVINPVIQESSRIQNTIPEKCVLSMSVRAANKSILLNVLERVKNCIQAGAIATGCSVEITLRNKVYEDLVPNHSLALSFKQALDYLQVPSIQKETANYSWDVGNVSHVCPTLAPYIKIGPESLVGHTDEFREASNSQDGYGGMIVAAKAMALTAMCYLTDTALRKSVQAEFKAAHPEVTMSAPF